MKSHNHKKLYHATFSHRLKKIKEEGIGGRSSKKLWPDSIKGLVYLSTCPIAAHSYTETAWGDSDLPDSWEDKIIVLVVDATKLDVSKLSLDENVIDNDGTTLQYEGVIPFNFITDVIKGNNINSCLS
jgi:hypothetical protein